MSEGTSGRRSKGAWLAAMALVAAYAAIMGEIARHRTVGDYLKETDFYHLYAPDADRIRHGLPPVQTYNTGPVYPSLLAVTTSASGTSFAAAKWLSLGAAGLAALAAFRLFGRLFGDRVALLALLFILTGADFARFSVQATTDMVFLALTVSAMLAISHVAAGRPAWTLAAGALSGLAGLTRYNGVFLLPTALTAIWLTPTTGARRGRAAGLYLLGCLVILGPWLVTSYQMHGTPLFTRTHLMMAIMAYDLPRDLDGMRAASDRFASIRDVVGRDPIHFARRYLSNLVSTVANSLGAPLAILPLGVLAVAGAILVMRRPVDPAARSLMVSLGLYLLLIALVHWESRYVLYVAVLYAGLAAHAVDGLAQAAQRRAQLRPAATYALATVLILFPLVPALVRTPRRVAEMLERQPVEILDAAAALRADAAGMRIMGRKPHLAYLVGGTWVYLPPVDSLGALREILCQTPAEYLVYDLPAQKVRRGLTELAEPTSGSPVAWLTPVYAHETRPLVVYAVRLDATCPPAAGS